MSLRALRIEAGKTQEQVAVDLRVGLRNYVRWESGVSKPGADNCLALLEYFRSALHRPEIDLRDLLAPTATDLAPGEVA